MKFINLNNTYKLRTFSLFTMICISVPIFADIVIPMQNRDGVFYIPCKVNGCSEEFIFDTGAANVCLSKKFLDRLISVGAITQSDKIGSGASQVADGRSIRHDIYNIRALTVGSRTIRNVSAVVIDGQNAPLLLGQTAIRKLGKIQFDKNSLIIKEASSSNKKNDSSTNIANAIKYYYNGNYHKAAEMLIQEWHNGALSNAQKLILMDSYNIATDVRGIGNREDALEILYDIDLDDEILNTFGEDKFYLISGVAFSGALRYYKARDYYRKAFDASSDCIIKARCLINIADSYACDSYSSSKRKMFDLYWDALDWLAMAFENETGTSLDMNELMAACLTPSYSIYTYMSEELRSLVESTTFAILLYGSVCDEYSYDDYNRWMNDLIESGNRFAKRLKKGY